jgi:hypothetical protein
VFFHGRKNDYCHRPLPVYHRRRRVSRDKKEKEVISIPDKKHALKPIARIFGMGNKRVTALVFCALSRLEKGGHSSRLSQ